MSANDAVRQSFRRGYTLIEILIVVALLGLASALLIPNMVGGDSLNAQAAVRLIISDLTFAQHDALAYQGHRKVYFYEDGTGYCITRVTESTYGLEFDEDTADYISDPLSSGGLYIVDFTADDRFDNITLEASIDGGGRELIFDPLGGTIRSGGLPGIGGTITVTAGDFSYQITVSPFTGKLTVQEL